MTRYATVITHAQTGNALVRPRAHPQTRHNALDSLDTGNKRQITLRHLLPECMTVASSFDEKLQFKGINSRVQLAVPRGDLNPLTPAVVIRVQLYSIMCQTGLSRHL